MLVAHLQTSIIMSLGIAIIVVEKGAYFPEKLVDLFEIPIPIIPLVMMVALVCVVVSDFRLFLLNCSPRSLDASLLKAFLYCSRVALSARVFIHLYVHC